MDNIQLTIQVLSGEIQTVNVHPSTSISELKQQIAALYQVSPSQLRLSITNGQRLQLDDDHKTVSDYGLRSEYTDILLNVMPSEPLQVFVKNVMGQTNMYNTTVDEPVDQLMIKIFQNEGVPVDDQLLIYNSQQLESGRKLQDNNIVPGSTIYMGLLLFENQSVQRMEITVDQSYCSI